MTTEAAEASHKFENSMHALHGSIQGVTMVIGTTFMPILTDIIKHATNIVIQFRLWVEKNPELARQVITLAAGAGMFAIGLGGIAAILPSVIAGLTAMLIPLRSLVGMA